MVDDAVAIDVGVIANTLHKAVCDARGETRTGRKESGRFGVDFCVQNVRSAGDDLFDLGLFVIFEAVDNAETVAERTSKRAGASRGADASEMGEVETDGTGGGAFAYDDVELIVLHRRIENLFNGATETVNFIDKEDVAVFEVGENAGEVAGTLDGRARGDAERGAELVGDDAGHGGFAEARRTV